MSRRLRIFSRPRPVTVEITQRTFQHRHLLQAEERLNRRIVGALAVAQKRYGGQIHAFVVTATHLHLLATFRDPKQMADFMRFFTRKVSIEVKKIHDWSDRVFPEPYVHIELAQEDVTELQRLRYILANGCKEGLVLSPLDWPGASSARALALGEPAEGTWLDRTGLCKARARRGRKVREQEFEEPVEVELSPLPSQAHLSADAYQELVLEIVRDIEEETLAMHRAAGTVPVGAGEVVRRHPHRKQPVIPRRSRPWCHASTRGARLAVKKAVRLIVAAYRDAARLLKQGARNVRFPAGTFPPGLPFVAHGSSVSTQVLLPARE